MAELRLGLQEAEMVKPWDLAARLRKIGFLCQRCGECCTGEDNSVVVFPFEVERIMEITGLDWLEAVEPPIAGEWDREGNFHTLEWRIRKENDSCMFYSGGGCRIYPARPLLCRTYPFYLEDGALCCSECLGLGRDLDDEKGEEIAELLITRCITELKEATALLEKYEDFQRGSPREDGNCIVHDSRGAHEISRKNVPLRPYKSRE